MNPPRATTLEPGEPPLHVAQRVEFDVEVTVHFLDQLVRMHDREASR